MRFRDLAFSLRLILGQVLIMIFLWYSRRNPPELPDQFNDLIGWLVMLAAMGGTLYGIWYVIRLSRYWRENPDGADSRTVGPLPMPANAISTAFMRHFKTAKVVVDLNARAIHFQNCFVPRQWLGREQAWFTCPLADLRAVYGSLLHYGEDLVICTIAGKAVVPRKAEGFAELRNFLMELVPKNDPEFVADDPRMFSLFTLVSLIGTLVGA